MQKNEISQYKEALESSKEDMQQCQKTLGFSSCIKCPKILECEIRDLYVKNTYTFLNGGEQEGGFDF